MTTDNNTTDILISRAQYSELFQISCAIRELATFFDETDIDFPATDLTPLLHSLSFRLSGICRLEDAG
jgi:hypothetical protein